MSGPLGSVAGPADSAGVLLYEQHIPSLPGLGLHILQNTLLLIGLVVSQLFWKLLQHLLKWRWGQKGRA